jgi:hypothetical protein
MVLKNEACSHLPIDGIAHRGNGQVKKTPSCCDFQGCLADAWGLSTSGLSAWIAF